MVVVTYPFAHLTAVYGEAWLHAGISLTAAWKDDVAQELGEVPGVGAVVCQIDRRDDGVCVHTILHGRWRAVPAVLKAACLHENAAQLAVTSRVVAVVRCGGETNLSVVWSISPCTNVTTMFQDCGNGICQATCR